MKPHTDLIWPNQRAVLILKTCRKIDKEEILPFWVLRDYLDDLMGNVVVHTNYWRVV